ncbi:MAG: peptidoglycan-binding protein [Alphaproteobacteria bacterium]|nr:peptidoglycan-binding protein [Alphaproteobacteria bacterium]
MNKHVAVWFGALAIMALAVAATDSFAAPPEPEVEVGTALVREIQFLLLRLGMDPGPIDGAAGPQTTKAFQRFEEQAGLSAVPLANGSRIPTVALERLRKDASRMILGNEAKQEPPPAAAIPPAAGAPAERPPDRFAACTYRPEDFHIGNTQYTPDKYLQEGFDGSTARAVSMLKDRLNEARQIAGSIGGAALSEVQRQARVLDYFNCRLNIEQSSASNK